MKKKIVIITLFLIIGWIVSCSKSDNSINSTTIDCSGTAKSYATDVSPIIQSYCATSGCHAAGSSNGPGALTTYQEVYNAQSSIRTVILNGNMPQGSSLTPSQKNNIVCWIDNGAANN